MADWPLAAVVAGLALGLGVTVGLGWEPGLLLVGVALLGAAGLRAWLPSERAGLLAVRSRVLDTAVLAVVGVGVIGLAVTLPR